MLPTCGTNRPLSGLLLAWLLLLSAAGYASNYDPVAVYLTWQHHPESTMTVCWITPPDRTADIVEYQREGSSEWQKTEGSHHVIPEAPSYLIHIAELTNLSSATNYYFRTGSDARPYKFQTMPTTLTGSIRFVSGGDMYHDEVELLDATNRQAAKTNPLFALIGGDIAYAADSKANYLPRWTHSWIDKWIEQKIDRWLTWLISWKNEMVTPDGRLVPILPVIGNHDTTGYFGQTPAQAPFFYGLFPMPGRHGCNVVDFGNYMSIILLDSGHTHPVDGPQAEWLAKTLEQRRDVPNTFALYHVPAYPSVRKFDNDISTQIRKSWVPSFDKYKLTAAFENHDHIYKRTYPLLYGKIDPKGVLYLGDGGWGVAKPRKAKKEKRWFLAKVVSTRHFISTEVQPNKRTATAITPEGQIIDQVVF